MYLFIHTFNRNTNWLQYILDEFCRIQGANFTIHIVENIESSYENVIYYSQEHIKDKCCVYDSSSLAFSDEITFTNDEVFIYKHTQNVEFEIPYDVFFNAFLFLSRYEEYIYEKEGRTIRSYASRHPRLNKKTFLTPIVNVLFAEFEKIILKHFPSLSFSQHTHTLIDWSHDIDYIKKTNILRGKQSIFNAYNVLRFMAHKKNPIPQLIRTAKFIFSKPSYWCFDYWTDLEKSLNKRSTFYVFVKTDYRKKAFDRYFIDPSYDLIKNLKLQTQLLKLRDEGFEIGLHGSYQSAKNMELLNMEKEHLVKILGQGVTKTRQHWLNYYELITPALHNKLFDYDSTIGWNDQMGFRSGCASLHRHYDHLNDTAYNYQIIPQVIMDATIYDYGILDMLKMEQEIDLILKSIQKIRNVHFSISWHQRTCSSDYNWHGLYTYLLKQLNNA